MGRAVFNGFRKLLCSSKLYITAVILFSCIYTGFGGINGYLMRQGQTVQAGELFVFGMDSWIPQLIITVAFLILVNDIPFGKSGSTTATYPQQPKSLAIGTNPVWLFYSSRVSDIGGTVVCSNHCSKSIFFRRVEPAGDSGCSSWEMYSYWD